MGTHVPDSKIVFPLYLAGNVHWLAALIQAGDKAVIDTSERFEKQSARSRFNLLGANGKLTLAMPLYHGEVRTQSLSKQLLFEERSNKRIHWKTIQSVLGSSPYYIHYSDALQTIFEKDHVFLCKFSEDILSFYFQSLGLPDLCFISENEISMTEIQADRRKDSFDFQSAEKYIQVFSDRFGFVQNLSALDLIFNLGPEALPYLQRQARG